MSELNTPDIIKRIEETLLAIGMSKKEFYENSGISSASFSQWNTGTHYPTDKKLLAAAKTLGVSYEYLVTGEQTKKPIPQVGDGLDEKRAAIMKLLMRLDEDQLRTLLRIADAILDK